MDKGLFGKKLKALRLARFPKPYDLTKASGVPVQTIESTEAGNRYPRLDLLEKWLAACGSTLPAFFAELAPEVESEKSKDAIQITIKRSHKKLHDKLEDILNGGGDAAAWISGNVTVFHNDHVRKRRDS